ncbi:hypothetical protein L3X38_026055 [Prunus dulcis]|uniref:Uncharacterized protein n=1 Tax=Prunus dulcis TaxID=3755 RepID=A0AAD4W3L8_PRUDU|nr:hypothetical protein L3X38_026055 [Prunus dulcis]
MAGAVQLLSLPSANLPSAQLPTLPRVSQPRPWQLLQLSQPRPWQLLQLMILLLFSLTYPFHSLLTVKDVQTRY